MQNDILLPGITVLAEETVRGTCLLDLIVSIALSTLAGVLMWAVCKPLITPKSTAKRSAKYLSRILFFLLVVLLLYGDICNIQQYLDKHTEYSVTVDDSVGFNEFNEKYAITGHNGDTYTVRIRSENREG